MLGLQCRAKVAIIIGFVIPKHLAVEWGDCKSGNTRGASTVLVGGSQELLVPQTAVLATPRPWELLLSQILSEMKPVYTLNSYFFKIVVNVILCLHWGAFKWFLPSSFWPKVFIPFLYRPCIQLALPCHYPYRMRRTVHWSCSCGLLHSALNPS
jgi:hypothetical protein